MTIIVELSTGKKIELTPEEYEELVKRATVCVRTPMYQGWLPSPWPAVSTIGSYQTQTTGGTT